MYIATVVTILIFLAQYNFCGCKTKTVIMNFFFKFIRFKYHFHGALCDIQVIITMNKKYTLK